MKRQNEYMLVLCEGVLFRTCCKLNKSVNQVDIQHYIVYKSEVILRAFKC